MEDAGQEGVKKSANVHIQLLLRIRFILYSTGMEDLWSDGTGTLLGAATLAATFQKLYRGK